MSRCNSPRSLQKGRARKGHSASSKLNKGRVTFGDDPDDEEYGTAQEIQENSVLRVEGVDVGEVGVDRLGRVLLPVDASHEEEEDDDHPEE